MALVLKEAYKGQIKGVRKATPKEINKYGKTTYAQGVRRPIMSEGNIVITTTWEKYNPQTKRYEQAYFRKKVEFNTAKILHELLTKEDIKFSSKYQYIRCIGSIVELDEKGLQTHTLQKYTTVPKELDGKEFFIMNEILYEPNNPNSQWNFKSIQAAAEYISSYMKKKGAEPNNNKGREYFISENGYWKQVTVEDAKGKRKDWKFFQYANSQWDNGVTLFSQWLLKAKNTTYRITFEQIKEVTLKPNDYHNQPADPWTHEGNRTIRNGNHASSFNVRTYKAEDQLDDSEQRKAARKKIRMEINKEERELNKLALTKAELQHENMVRMQSRPTKGQKTAERWLRKIKKTNPTWLQYAANARSLAEHAVKMLDSEMWTITQAESFCEKNAKYL